MKKIIIPTFLVFLILGNCYAKGSISLQDPIEIKEVLYYRDGGTTGAILKDITGIEISFCFTPQSNLFYGATHASFNGAQAVEAKSDLELTLLSVMQRAIDVRYDNQKQKELSETEAATGLSKKELDIWHLLRALNLYKENRKEIIYKKGKTEIAYINDGNSPNYTIISKCSTEAQNIINKYNINKNQIENCQSKSFFINRKKIEFVHIEYGMANDCPSGCFFSHFCTIVDGDIDYPYAFYFTNEQEDILGIEETVESGIPLWSKYYGKDKLTGLKHPLVQDKDFLEFKDNEITHGGDTEQGYKISDFRWCK